MLTLDRYNLVEAIWVHWNDRYHVLGMTLLYFAKSDADGPQNTTIFEKKSHFWAKKYHKIEILTTIDQKGAKWGKLIRKYHAKDIISTLLYVFYPRPTSDNMATHFRIFDHYQPRIWSNFCNFRGN